MPPKRRVTKKVETKEEDDQPNEVVTTASEEVVPPASASSVSRKDPIILQLPIAPSRLEDIMDNTAMHGVLEYNPTIVDPQPYIPHDAFMCDHDSLQDESAGTAAATAASETLAPAPATGKRTSEEAGTHGSTCFWCCHSIPHIEYGMPIRYDVFHKSFTLFGSFCSLECAAAYNFATHMGSDRVWEIHSWIQMLAQRYGYSGNIRPAPSKYLLKMFNGPLSIEEFRQAHRGLARTYMMNIPPFIHVVSQMEVLNTSFLDSSGNGATSSADKKTTKRRVACVKGTAAVFEAAAE